MELKRTLIEPKIVEKDAFQVMGIKIHSNPMTIDYDKVWERFMSSYYDEVVLKSIDKVYYNIYFNTNEEDVVDFIAGMSVNYGSSVPKGLTIREVPAARYAMFGCLKNAIELTYDFIYKTWFPVSKYEYDDKPSFEYFSPDSSEGNIPVLIYIPIREKAKKVNDIKKFSSIEKEQLQEKIHDFQKSMQKNLNANVGKTTGILIFALILGLFLICVFFPSAIPAVIIIFLLLVRVAMWLASRE